MSPTSARPSSPPARPPAISGATERRLEDIWRRAYGAQTKDDLRSLYADWASTYDEDHDLIGFEGHRRAAALLARFTPAQTVAPVLDAGAGTGAAGVALRQLGFENLTAIDLSADMLAKAASKGVYRQVLEADLGLPLDMFPANHFDAAILVGVFSYGQAPAYALEEMVRVVKPGGVIVFTMRTDFYESNAMDVRATMDRLAEAGAWRRSEVTEPAQYLPKIDPGALYRVWCYRVLDQEARVEPPEALADAVRSAFLSDGPVNRLDHCHIWDSRGSRLYNRYIACEGYYLSDCELEILRAHANEIVGGHRLIVELGCGSAQKITPLLEAALRVESGRALEYLPIDLSTGALEHTRVTLTDHFADRLRVSPKHGHFDDVLTTIPADLPKTICFFGSSLGNIETLDETVQFLQSVRDRMTTQDRFVLGLDLHKSLDVLKGAYEAGPPAEAFFLNMLRRINDDLGGNLDLEAFELEATYDLEGTYREIEDRSVNFKLVSQREQVVYLRALDLETTLSVGDVVQVGTSRKFRREDITRLLALAGLAIERQWLDRRKYFSVTECRRVDE